MGRRVKDISGFVKDLIAIEDIETKKRIYKKRRNQKSRTSARP